MVCALKELMVKSRIRTPGHSLPWALFWLQQLLGTPAGQIRRVNAPEAALPTQQVTEVLRSAGRMLNKFSAVSQSCHEGYSSRSYRTVLALLGSLTHL